MDPCFHVAHTNVWPHLLNVVAEIYSSDQAIFSSLLLFRFWEPLCIVALVSCSYLQESQYLWSSVAVAYLRDVILLLVIVCWHLPSTRHSHIFTGIFRLCLDVYYTFVSIRSWTGVKWSATVYLPCVPSRSFLGAVKYCRIMTHCLCCTVDMTWIVHTHTGRHTASDWPAEYFPEGIGQLS